MERRERRVGIRGSNIAIGESSGMRLAQVFLSASQQVLSVKKEGMQSTDFIRQPRKTCNSFYLS